MTRWAVVASLILAAALVLASPAAAAETQLTLRYGPIHMAPYELKRGDATYEGQLYLASDGSVETVFDDLPNFQATLAEIAVEGGSRGILLTPRRCGRYAIHGVFDSHAGGRVTRTQQVQIAGCPVRPLISRVRLRPRRFRRRTVLRWRLSQPAGRTSVSVQRLGREGWRELRVLAGPGRVGKDSLRISGRRLRPGRYRFVLRASGRSPV